MKDDIIEKIQKILARADTARGATQAEAETAMAMVQKLCIAHNISLAQVEAANQDDKPAMEAVKTTVMTRTKYEMPYHKEIFSVLMECFDIRIIYNSHWNQNAQRVFSRILLLGEATDIAIATYCWDWLQQIFPKAYSNWRKEEGLPDKWVLQTSFYRGMRQGIIENNRRQRQELNKDTLITTKFAELFKGTKRARDTRRTMDYNAAESGYAKGRDIKLNAGLSSGDQGNQRLR